VGESQGKAMNIFENEDKATQLLTIERIAHNLQGEEFEESVREIINKAMDGNMTDLSDALTKKNRTAYDFGVQTDSLVKTIISQEIQEGLARMACSLPPLQTRVYDALCNLGKDIMKDIKACLADPVGTAWGDINFCTECGKFLQSGFHVSIDELYC
jgi:hypothetical protein